MVHKGNLSIESGLASFNPKTDDSISGFVSNTSRCFDLPFSLSAEFERELLSLFAFWYEKHEISFHQNWAHASDFISDLWLMPCGLLGFFFWSFCSVLLFPQGQSANSLLCSLSSTFVVIFKANDLKMLHCFVNLSSDGLNSECYLDKTKCHCHSLAHPPSSSSSCYISLLPAPPFLSFSLYQPGALRLSFLMCTYANLLSLLPCQACPHAQNYFFKCFFSPSFILKHIPIPTSTFLMKSLCK